MRIIKTEDDFTTSVFKALREIDPDWKDIRGCLVVGSHAPAQVEDKLRLIRTARENNIPFLGICLGLHLMAVDFARNVLQIPGANTAEVDGSSDIVTRLPELRVGIRPVMWNGKINQESHWHNYAVNPKYKTAFNSLGLKTLAETDGVIEIMKWKGHPFGVGVQFHPEYQSNKMSPHPILQEFIGACRSNPINR